METNNNCSNNNSKKSDIAIKKSTQDLYSQTKSYLSDSNEI